MFEWFDPSFKPFAQHDCEAQWVKLQTHNR